MVTGHLIRTGKFLVVLLVANRNFFLSFPEGKRLEMYRFSWAGCFSREGDEETPLWTVSSFGCSFCLFSYPNYNFISHTVKLLFYFIFFGNFSSDMVYDGNNCFVFFRSCQNIERNDSFGVAVFVCVFSSVFFPFSTVNLCLFANFFLLQRFVKSSTKLFWTGQTVSRPHPRPFACFVSASFWVR